MTDVEEIARVLASYCYIVDDMQWERIDEVFTADATVAIAGTPLSFTGLDSIRRFMTKMKNPPIAHYTSDLVIDVGVDGQSASSRSKLLALNADGTASLGAYVDTLVRVDGGWRVNTRQMLIRPNTWPTKEQ
jgi:hypothetical protein